MFLPSLAWLSRDRSIAITAILLLMFLFVNHLLPQINADCHDKIKASNYRESQPSALGR